MRACFMLRDSARPTTLSFSLAHPLDRSEREGGGKREKEGGRERERDGERESVRKREIEKKR